LSQLPKGLEETYFRCIKRIAFSETCALKVLKWVSFATYPLHIEELREAVAFDIEDDSWDAAKIPRAEFIIGCCANLVVVDPTDNCVRFAHSSVRQFLDSNRENYILGYPQSAEEGQLECGELCIAYLSFSNFGLELVNPDNQTVAINVPISTPISLAGESLGPPFTKLFSKVWKTKTSPMPLEFRRLQPLPKPGVAQYRFLNYAAANWALQTKHIKVKSPMWHKFKQLAFTFNESWNFHPWMSGGRSALSRLHSLFGWAVKEQHIPLLTLATNSKKDIKEVCDIPLIDEGIPALHVAAKLGYKQVLKVLLNICTVNRFDKDGFTALHHAVMKGQLGTVKMLSSAPGVDIDARSSKNFQRSPLWVAAHHGRLEIATVLINRGANLNVKDATSGRTPLFCAVECANFGLVEVLLQNGCDANSEDSRRRTPFFQAMKNNDPITSRLLLEKTFITEGRGLMLFLAAENNFETIMELLLVNSTRTERLFRDSKGLTPLHLAVRNGFETITRQIITHSSQEERNSKDNEGLTPLHWAVRNGFEAITRLILLDSGREERNSKDNEGLTPLHWAARNGFEEITSLLLRYLDPVEMQITDNKGLTPLHWAAINGFETTIEQLLVYANPQNMLSRDSSGRRALHSAAMNGREQEVKALLERTTNIDCVDNWGQTPLMLAVQNNNIPIIELLVEHGAEPGFRDNRERSPLSFAKTTAVMNILYNDFTPDRYPLIWAVVEGNEEEVASLLKQGLYPDDIGPGGYTALYWANRNKNKTIIKLLKK
jgi:ankyrin repeat protein